MYYKIKRWKEKDREMTDKVIGSVIILFLMIVLNVKDFINLLNNGTNRYIQRYSGMLCTLVGLVGFVYKFNLRKIEFLVYGIYIAIYTLIYFKIKKIKEERKNNEKMSNN